MRPGETVLRYDAEREKVSALPELRFRSMFLFAEVSKKVEPGSCALPTDDLTKNAKKADGTINKQSRNLFFLSPLIGPRTRASPDMIVSFLCPRLRRVATRFGHKTQILACIALFSVISDISQHNFTISEDAESLVKRSFLIGPHFVYILIWQKI